MMNEKNLLTGSLADFLDDAAWRFEVRYGGQDSVMVEDEEILSNSRRRKLTDILVDRRPSATMRYHL